MKWTCREISEEDFFSQLQADFPIAWFGPDLTLAGAGPAFAIRPDAGPDRFSRSIGMLDALKEWDVDDEVDLPGSGPVAFGSFSFSDSSGDSLIVIPRIVFGRSEGVTWKTELVGSPAVHVELFEDPQPGPPPPWEGLFKKAAESIASGQFEKVVLARTRSCRTSKSAIEVLGAFVQANPGCFNYAVGNFVGSSPELLVRRFGMTVDSVPVAGSSRRGLDVAQDETFAEALRASTKDRREHELTLSSVMETLEQVCSRVSAEDEPSVLTLAHIHHLATKVQGTLRENLSALDVAGMLHPTAAVAGLPLRDALDFIATHEGIDRGAYAGPVGWMDRRGDGEWAVALRCCRLRNGQAQLWAGAGIVEGSDMQAEFAEIETKFQTALAALSNSSL